MAITFLDEEEDIVATAEPPRGESRITFLDEEEPVSPAVEPTTQPVVEPPKITFLDEEPATPSIGGLTVPPAPEIPKFEAAKPSEGVLRQAADLPVQFAIGINNSIKGLSDLFGADNPVSQNLSQNVDWYRGLLSAASKQDEEEVGRILQEAENKGLLDQLGAGLEAFSVAPADFVASGLGSLAVFAAGGLVGRAAGLGAKGIQAVQAGLGAGMGAGIAKGEIYQSVKDEMLSQGKTEEEAKSIAMEAQSFGGKNLDQILIAAGLGTIDAYTGAEKIIGKVLAKGGLKPDANRVGNILKTGITEAVPEFAQAAQEKFASNLALNREGVNVPLTQGVFSQGALEGLVGLGLGVGAGAIEPRIQTEPTKEEVSAAAAETQEVARRSMDVAPATASLVEGEAEQIIQSQAETPDQRLARLRQEEQEAAGDIELEEEPPVSGLPAQPVTPTPEAPPIAPVAPVEPVVPAEGAVEPTVTEVAPEGTKEEQDLRAAQERVRRAQEVIDRVRDLPLENPEVEAAYTERTASRANLLLAEVAARHPNSKNISKKEDEEAFLAPLQALAPLRPTEEPLTEGKKWRKGEEVGYNESVGKITKAIPPEGQPNTLYRVVTREDYERILATGQIDSDMRGAITTAEGINLTPNTATATYYLPRGETGVVLAIDPTGLDLNFIQGDSYVRSFNPIPVDRIIGRSDFIHKDAETGSYLLRPQDNAPVANEPESIVNYTKAAPTPEAAPVTPTPTEPEAQNQRVAAYKNEYDSELNKAKENVRNALFSGEGRFKSSGPYGLTYLITPSTNPDVLVRVTKLAQDGTPMGHDDIRSESEIEPYLEDSLRDGVVRAALEQSRPDLIEGWRFAAVVGRRDVRFRYRLRLRPASVGTQPEGATIVGEREVEYDRPLTSQELSDFEMEPIGATEVAPTPTAEPPTLAPLRRVAKAEQTEDDVSGLVGQGLVELYKGQPVITQAGLETLPEAERPRLTPEARKIQIDTRTSEAAAEAISKNLRIGVDQVPVDVKMPAGWTLVGDVYVPPTKMAKIETFDVEALAEVDETSDVFANVIKRKDEAKAAVAQKPEGSAFATQEEFRAAFDLRGEGYGRFATRLDLMVADGVITSEGRDLIMAVIYDNNTDDTFLNNIEMGSMRARTTSAYGRGGVSRQTVQSAKGKVIGYKPLLKMMRNARQNLQIDEKTAQTLSTFWHEFGHAGYYSLLNQTQKDQVAAAYKKTTKAQRRKFFESGVAAARQGDVTAQYYAKSETEWFAQSFAEYVLTQKSNQKSLVPIFESILNKIKGVFGKLFSRKEGTPELNDIFEYIIQGKDYGSTKIWWNGLQLSLDPAVYGTRGAQPIDPDFSKRLVEREKQNRAKALRSVSAPETVTEEPTVTGEVPPTAAEFVPAPTFPEESPEAKTLSTMRATMEKVDAASEAKGGKPETQKISEIAANWMEQGGDTRALQDAIVENTNLSPANAQKVANAIARQYNVQQQIAETGAVVADITPEPEGAPRKSSVTKLIEATTGVRKPIVKLQVSETAALKKQIQLKAREARETRKARKEAAEELAKSITDYIKENPIRGPINSRQAMSITKKALKLDVNNEAAVDRFEMYVDRVIENANYDRDLADARSLIKRAKAFAKTKDTQGNVKTTLEAIANVSPNLLDNPFEFNLVVQRYLLGLAPVTAKQYAVMPDADVRQYLESLETQIKSNQEILDRAKAQRILDKQSAYAEEKGIPLDEAISILNSEEFLQEKTIEKLEDLTKLLTAMAQESQKDVKAYDETGATPKQKELISFMRKVSLDSLTNEEKKRYIRFSNNLLANGATFGMEQFQSIALGQEAAIKALKDKRLSNKLAAWISPIGGDKAIDTARRIALRTQSEADTFKNIFGREAVGAIRKLLGLNRLDSAQTDSNRAKEQIANEVGEYYASLRKKYGDDATGFEAKGYAGVAGYLIQTDGIKTEAESIPYRRRLLEQNIAELRKSDKQADLTEADFKERALSQLTGTSNAEILSQLQALNPASYEQLMWWKDTMLPKWREFLKEHDENFRNQANNYNNPDHLTITYKFPEGQLLPNEIEKVYQQDHIGMRIKQAANSIKRKDHPNLPVAPQTGTIANIDINFGYNQYNALVDQVDKAYVAPAWEQVVAFTKAPEFEQIMGGRANANFVKKLLVDIQTSRTRQSMTDDEAQMVAGGVRLARKISTQAVLGGFTQPLRQVPDQLSKLFFTTGRFDLITKNLLNIAQAAPLMNKFPIGRRGDAQAGTQYASQFSELARRVEASVTDRKWAKYRELMNRVGEFWMTPLRGSDVWAAKVSWMTYYEAYLNKQDIKMESWEREAELVDTDDVRKEAAAYAEYAVDFYGGASDPTKMASLSKQTNNGWKEFAKLMFLPLNSFALQQKNSLISDMRDAYLRTGDRKAAIAGIAGTLAGMASFHAMRIYIIGGLLYPAGKALLMGVFGIDMDEPDEEEKQKKLEDDWRKFKASMYGNIIAGGAGQFVEQSAIDAVNKATYLIQANVNPDELLNDRGEVMSFRQYEKDLSPLYRFRSFGTSEYSFGLADVLTEQAQRSLMETQQIMTAEEVERYTGNEQAYAMFSTMVEWLYFFRLMDTDVTRIARDLKRQMDKGVEEREAEIRAIRSGR